MDSAQLVISGKNDLSLYTSFSTNIVFRTTVTGAPILVIDKEGIIYKGERVKDAGEAYKAMMDVLNKMKQ